MPVTRSPTLRFRFSSALRKRVARPSRCPRTATTAITSERSRATTWRTVWATPRETILRQLPASDLKEARGEAVEMPKDGYHGDYIREIARDYVADRLGDTAGNDLEAITRFRS